MGYLRDLVREEERLKEERRKRTANATKGNGDNTRERLWQMQRQSTEPAANTSTIFEAEAQRQQLYNNRPTSVNAFGLPNNIQNNRPTTTQDTDILKRLAKMQSGTTAGKSSKKKPAGWYVAANLQDYVSPEAAEEISEAEKQRQELLNNRPTNGNVFGLTNRTAAPGQQSTKLPSAQDLRSGLEDALSKRYPLPTSESVRQNLDDIYLQQYMNQRNLTGDTSLPKYNMPEISTERPGAREFTDDLAQTRSQWIGESTPKKELPELLSLEELRGGNKAEQTTAFDFYDTQRAGQNLANEGKMRFNSLNDVTSALENEATVEGKRYVIGQYLDSLPAETKELLKQYEDGYLQYNSFGEYAVPENGGILTSDKRANSSYQRSNMHEGNLKLQAARDALQEQMNLTDAGIDKLLAYAEYDINYRENTRRQDEIDALVHTGNTASDALNAAGMTAKTILSSPYSGTAATIGNVANYLNGGRSELGTDTYSPTYGGINYSQNVRGSVQNRIAENGTKAGQIGAKAYGIGTSMADSAMNMLTGSLTGLPGAGAIGKAASLIPFGASAYATTLQDNLEKGIPEEKAQATAIVAGLAEMGTEVFSLDHFWEIAAKSGSALATNYVADLVAQSLIEGSEEIASGVINEVADRLINADQSEYWKKVEAYSETMSEEEAKRQAELEFLKELAEEGIGGAISGGIMGSIGTGVNISQTNTQARRAYENQNLIESAQELSQNRADYVNESAYNSAVRARQQADQIIEKQNTGEKITNRVLRNLYRSVNNALNIEAETRQNEKKKSITVPESGTADDTIIKKYTDYYAGKDNNLNVDDVVSAMAQANTAEELVEIRKAAENAADQSTKSLGKTAFELNKSRVMSENNQTVQDFERAEKVLTQSEAFEAGLNGQELSEEQLNDTKIKRAYNDGKKVGLIRHTQESLNHEIKGMNVTIADGTNVQLTGGIDGIGENAKVQTSTGEIEINQLPDSAIKYIYQHASAQNDQTAAQTYINNYPKGMPVGSYDNAFNKYYVAGATGTANFNELYSKDSITKKWMNEQQAKAIFDYGNKETVIQRAYDIDYSELPVLKHGEGKVYDQRANKENELDYLPIIEAFAKGLKTDYILTDEVANNINGQFNRGIGAVLINTNKVGKEYQTIIHENIGEMIQAFNPEGHARIQQPLMDYMAANMSQEDFTNLAKRTQIAYQEVEGSKAIYAAMGEVMNNQLAGIFSTKEGMDDLTNFLQERYGVQESKTILQSIADFFKKAADSLMRLVNDAKLSSEAKQAARMAESQAREIRKMVLEELGTSIESAQNARIDENAGEQIANSVAYAERNDEYSGGIRHSIDTIAESLNLAFEKDGHTTVLKDQYGNKITNMTPAMVRQTPLGAMLNSGIKNGFITEEDAKNEYQFISDLVNQMLKTQDLDLIFAVNSVIGFQEIPSGERAENTKNPRKSKNAGYVSNSDPQYSTTIDFTTICVKSQAIIDVMSETMKRLGRGLTEDEITKIVYKNTHEAGEPVPCPVCYVFSRWVGLGGLFDKMNNLQKQYADADVSKIRSDMTSLDKQIAEVQKQLDGSKKTKGKAKERLYKDLKEEAAPIEKLLNAEKLGGKTLLTDEQRNRYETIQKQLDLLDNWTWLEKVRMSKNYKPVPADVLFDINAGTRFANEYPESWTYRTTRGPAMGKAATPYADEHLGQVVRGIGSPSSVGKNLGDLTKNPFIFAKGENGVDAVTGGKLSAAASTTITNAIKKARVQNLLNGQRMQSTSDFRFEYALDYLMSLYELQTVGAKVQLYTKVPESVGFLASAGAEINCSLMPFEDGYEKDANGNPVYDKDGTVKLLFSDVTGMHPDDAFRLSAMYDNVQPIVVGTNDTQIRALMADPRVTFIIPYHASGSGEQRYIEMMQAVGENVKSRTDYSAYQMDVEKPDATAEQKAAYNLRKDIVTGKAKNLTQAQKDILKGNEILHQLYQRFYGKDMNGNTPKINNKYLNAADRGANGYGTVDHETLNTFMGAKQAETIMPYEFWDKTLTVDQADRNGFILQEYCEALGLYPRFSGYTSKGTYNAKHDFTQVPGYWKTIPDRKMYNNDGTYHEQQAINVANMKMDYLDRAKTVEGIAKPSVENDRNKVEVIVQKSIEDIQNSKDTDRVMNEGSDIRYSVEVTDQDTLDFLNNQSHVKTYRTFQKIGDGLYSPMNMMENGKRGYESRIGVWEQATEDPSQVKDGKYPLKAGGNTDSGKSRTTWAAYNPYLHSSNTVFNDQFAAAYDRSNLVVVECEVPSSEVTSGYHADQAKDPTGWIEWKSGSVSNALKSKGIVRMVMLSRWMKPVRILENSEVAQIYKDTLEGTDIKIPWNVVSPGLRKELEKLNVPIDYGYQSQVKASFEDKFGKAGVENQNPTENHDIRNSLEFADDDISNYFDEMQSEYDQMTLRDAGRILAEGAKHLSDLKISDKAAEKIAGEILKKYGSKASKTEFTENLEKVFAFIQENPDANFNDVMKAIKDIAAPIIEEATEKVGQPVYDKFIQNFKGRKIKLTDLQKEEVSMIFGSYNAFRYAMKKINISSKGTDLTSLWGELSEAMPDLLPYDAAEGNMPLALYDALMAVTPTVSSIYGANNAEATEDLAMEIVRQYFAEAGTVSGDNALRDAATRMQKLNDEYRETIKNRYDQRFQEAKKALIEEYKEKGKVFDRGLNLNSVADILARHAKEALQRKEEMEAVHERNIISSQAAKMYKWASNPTPTHHIPEKLMDTVMEFVQALDFASPPVEFVNGEYKTKIYDPENHKMLTLKAESQDELYKQIEEALGTGKGWKAQQIWSLKMASMKKLYNQVAKGEQFKSHTMDDLVHSLDKSLAEELEDLFERNKDVLRVSQMSSDDLKVIKKVLNNISHAILVEDKAFSMPSKEISALANDTMKSVNKHTARKERTKFGNRVVDFLTLDMATPKTYFSMANSDSVYKILRKALNKKFANLRKAQAEFEKIIEGVDEKTRKSWDEVKTYNIRGQEFQMNDKQLMSLYELNKRQQAMVHMPGGITITTLDVKKNGLLGKLGVKVQHTQFKPVHLTASEIKELVSNLTDQQKDIADKMQHYMATECSQWGNEAARLMYGYEKFTEENYFPIKTDRNSISMQASNVSQLYNAIADMGFTKQVKPGARNALVISDIFDVFSDHVVDMATYNAYAPAIADVLRWYNFRTTDTDAANNFDYTESVQGAVQALLGNGGKNYFAKLIRDINEQEQSSYIGGFWSGITSRYKIAAVGANIRVVAQQPTAIVRARNLIDDKYLIKGMSAVIHFKESTKHATDLSEIAWWKSQGFYESNIGPTMKKLLTGESTAVEKLQEKSLALAGIADDLGYSILYKAVEYEQADKFKAAGLKITGEDEAAFRQAVNDRYDDVIDETQVVDSTLHRSQFMRSTDALNKMQAAFMAEPTKSYNMLMKAASDAYKSAEGEGIKAYASVANSKVFKRAAVSFVVTNVVNAAVQSMIDAMRSARRDDDKDYWERFQNAMLENVRDNVNPLNLMPWVKDASDIISNKIKELNGESTYLSNNSRMDLAAIQNFANAAANTIKYLQGRGSKTGFGVAYSDLQALSQLTGIPVYNMTRDLTALYDSIRHKYFYDLPNLFETSIDNAKSVARNRVYKAIDEGGDYKQAIEYAEKVGVNISVNGLATSITNKYKDEYPALLETDPNAAMILKNRLEQVYTYLYDLEGKEFKGRKWLTDAAEEEPEAENETIDLTGEDYGTEAGSRDTFSSEPIGYTPMDDWDYSSSINSEFEENPTAANFGAYRDRYPAVMGEVREKPIERSQTGTAYLTSEYAEQNREALTEIIARAKTDNKNGLYTIGEFVKAMEDRGAVFYDLEELNVRYNEYLNSVTTFGNSREKRVTEGSADVHIRETDRDIRGMAKYENPKPGYSSYSPEQWVSLMHGFNTNQQVLHNMEEKNQDALAEIVAEYKTSNNPTIMSKQRFADVLIMKGGIFLNEDNVNALYQEYMNDVNTFGRRREKRVREGTANVRARDIPAED